VNFSLQTDTISECILTNSMKVFSFYYLRILIAT